MTSSVLAGLAGIDLASFMKGRWILGAPVTPAGALLLHMPTEANKAGSA